jgi:two-component system nitrate/nitrite response regulator NarL
MPNPIRLLIVDDQPLIKDALAALLKEEPDLVVVGCAANGEEALDLAAELQPDIVLMDLVMPVMDGLEAARRFKADLPAVKVLILTMHDSSEYVMQVMQAGAAGYVLKDIRSDTLLRTIKSVQDGLFVFPPVHLLKAATVEVLPKTALTETEVKVFVLLVRGVDKHSSHQKLTSSSAIAKALQMTTRAVEAHRANIRDRLGNLTPLEMVRYALKHGLIEDDDNMG